MSSSLTEERIPLERGETVRTPRRGLLKRLLPRTLFGRSLLIIVTPLVLLQIISAWIFYDRHWETISRRLSTTVAGDIGVVIQTLPLIEPADQPHFFARAANMTELTYYLEPHATLLPAPLKQKASEPVLAAALEQTLRRPFHIRSGEDPRQIYVAIQVPSGILNVAVPRQRLYSSTTYIFVLWMVGSSLILFAVATLFMRNQVRSLRRLAAAAESFGKGRNVPNFKLEGATEIRQAAAAFLAMRDRIQRQISQRTEMLAGVSHDLRTPLTRMKLALALLGEGLAIEELKSDVAEMEKMVQGYLDFARGEGAEAPIESDLSALLEEIASDAKREGASISLTAPSEFPILLRRNALKRCIGNLVSNARRHGTHVWMAALPGRDGVDVLVDDDGPGIPADQREAVFRPFHRLDPSRNIATGGVGLGLTIARDVARGHGGDLALEDSPQGGLRCRLHLPS